MRFRKSNKPVSKKWDGSIKKGGYYLFKWHSDGMVSNMTAEDVKKQLSPNRRAGKVIGLGVAPKKKEER